MPLPLFLAVHAVSGRFGRFRSDRCSHPSPRYCPIEASSALTETQKRRVVAKAGPTLRAVAQDERSQLRNRELAVERLVDQLRVALKVPRRRVATKPTKASREKRLESKTRRATTKRLRRRPD